MLLSQNKKKFILCVCFTCLMVLIGCWITVQSNSDPPSLNSPEPPISSRAVKATAEKSKQQDSFHCDFQYAQNHTRRDKDYWLQEPHPISMRYRVLHPSYGLPSEAPPDKDQRIIWIVQFGGPLNGGDIQDLRTRGIEILLPTLSNAFHVRASYFALCQAVPLHVPKILGWDRLRPEDKLVSGPLPNGCGTATKIRLELYPDANEPDVTSRVALNGGKVISSGRNCLEVSGPATAEFSKSMAEIEDVYAVDVPRPQKKVFNEDAATASTITPLLSAPQNLTGAGISVMVRDEGRIFSHPDFGSRLLFGPDVTAQTPVVHSTHVAGTIGGDGSNDPTARARGMAPGCTIVNYDLNGDDVNEPLDAKTLFGVIISNHSYGFVTGWDNGTFNNNQGTFGTYSSFARDWDSIIRSENIIMIKAVGNDRNDTGSGFPHDGKLAADGEYYNTVDASSTGKNIISVGSTIDSAQAGVTTLNTSVLPSSSSGPCADGRLRPEIQANGDAVISCNDSAIPGSQYTRLSGTSMASAVVTGASAVFLEHYKKRFGSGASCTPYFLRALYAQTSTDLGQPGPDYLHGFGMLDLSGAVNLFEADSPTHIQLMNSTLSATSPERFFMLGTEGLSPIKATLCWNDDAGDILASKAIVNDLDLRLVSAVDQSIRFPFKLDPSLPDEPATEAVNSVDTIEQLILYTPSAGNYLLAVRSATLVSSTDFTLASSLPLTEVLAPIAKFSASNTSGAPPLTVTFDGSESSDPDGSISAYHWNFGDGTSGTGIKVQHTYPAGNFKVTLTVIDYQGASAGTTLLIGIANKPPVAVAAASPATGMAPLTCLFSSAGSNDQDGKIIDFAWDFGDGTVAQGATVTHTFAAAGLYFASLVVTDEGGATAGKSMTIFAGQTLVANSSRFRLNFQKLGRDSFSFFSKSFVVPTDLVVAGLMGTVRIGSTEYGFTLNEKGDYNVPPLKLKLNTARSQIRITISGTNLDNALSASKATSRNTPAPYELIQVPLSISLNNDNVYGSKGFPFGYSAKLGKSGRGRLIKPPK